MRGEMFAVSRPKASATHYGSSAGSRWSGIAHSRRVERQQAKFREPCISLSSTSRKNTRVNDINDYSHPALAGIIVWNCTKIQYSRQYWAVGV